jgi:hypothetical protein
MADSKISALPSASTLIGTELVELVQAGANVRSTVASLLALVGVISDHGLLGGLNDDDHLQYHTDGRGDARYPPLARQIISGAGLTGGGDLTADRTLAVGAGAGISVAADAVAVDINSLTVLGGAVDGANDFLVIFDASVAALRKVSPNNAVSGASGTVPSSRVVTAGLGLSGGGALSADITIDVGPGDGIVVDASSVALDPANSRNVAHSGVSISAGTGLTGGGTIEATRTIALDTANTRNVDHAAVSITGDGGGLLGGGDLTASRSLYLAANGIAFDRLNQVSTGSFLGRQAAGTGSLEQLSSQQAVNLLPTASGANKGAVPAPGALTQQQLTTEGWKAQFRGATLSGAAQIISLGAFYNFEFDSQNGASETWWTAGQSTRLVVPSGIDRLLVEGQATVQVDTGSVVYSILVTVKKNGSGVFVANGWIAANASAAQALTVTLARQLVDVVSGDYFELEVRVTDVTGGVGTATILGVGARTKLTATVGRQT